MGIFDFFGQGKPKQDPYWDYHKEIHFRPKLNKGDFFKRTGFDFGWFVLEPISKFVKDTDNEIEKGKGLSYGQKALYYWWYVDGQVTNGGFVQFYYNGYGPYVPTIIKSLEYIGDNKMAELIQRAEKIYQKNKKLMDRARKKDLFGSDLYEKLEEMSALDDEYYKLHDKTMTQIEKYIRKNPNEICLDEEGKEFDLKFSGECKAFYSKNLIKEIFYLENGIINGEFKSFYESGKTKEQIQYSKGGPTGERVEYYENGNKKYSIRKDFHLNQFEHCWYYENGNPKKLEHKQLDKDERVGEYKEWYNNGQLAETGTYISAHQRIGKWLEFYENGSKKLEAEFKNGNFLLQNCWNEKGVQTLKDGTGIYVHGRSGWEGHLDRNEQVYKNYQRHGPQKTFSNGVLRLYQEMENGTENGFTRTYYKNGKIKEEKVYKDGKELSTKTFPMFDNPKVVTEIICEMKDEWLTNRGLEIADIYPIAINNDEISNAFIVNISFFEGYSQDNDLNYNYFVTVDEKGNVLESNFLSASNVQIAKEVESNILKLKFKPALKNGTPIRSYVIVKHEFKLAEK